MRALLVLVVILVPVALAQDALAPEVFDIARELRCPVCVAESVADSNADISIQMRETIARLLEEGRSRDEIYAFFEERYGDWIFLAPPKRGATLLVWLLPVIAAGAGAVALVVLLRRWRRAAEIPLTLDEADRDYLSRVRSVTGGDGGTEGGRGA